MHRQGLRVRDAMVQTVREWLRDRAEQSSLRQLAPSVGVGHSTLHNFVTGADPHPRVWRLLRTYYQRETSEAGADADVPREALAVLTSALGGERQMEAERAMLDELENVHRAAGVEVPLWFGMIRGGS